MIRLFLSLLVVAAVASAAPEPSPPPIRDYQAAQAGDPVAQLKVSEYYSGMFAKSQIGQHYEEALKWARKSARSGHFQGMAMVVQLRLDNGPPRRDVKEAYDWLRRLHDHGRVETMYAARLAHLLDSAELGEPAHDQAYFFCLLQRMTGLMPHDTGRLQQRLRERDLKPEQVAEIEQRAFEWWEDRNKPALPAPAPAAATPNNPGSTRLAKPLGKENKYLLRGSDDIEQRRK